MPFVLAPELAAVAAAALLAMLCIAVVYMIRAIAAALGTLHVGPISLPFGKWFSAITTPVVSWLVGATNELWADVGWWMHGIAYIATGFANDVAGLFSHTLQQVDHVVTVTIPDAAAQALHDARTFTGDAASTITRDIATATRDIEKVASADAARALAKAKSIAHGVESDLTRIVAHDLTTAEHYTDGAVAGVKDWVDGEIAKIHLPTLESIGAAPAALVGTVAGIGAAVAALASEFESCAVTSCAGKNNFGNLLQDALGVSSFVVLAEFIKQAINDPVAAEHIFAGQASGLYHDANSLLDSLLAL